jgi:hypothetical protein
MTAPVLTPLGNGWTARTTYSTGAVCDALAVRQIERAIVMFRHVLGGRAEATLHRPLTGGDWSLVAAAAWTVCTDPACARARGFAHALTERVRISGDELGVLVTDRPALTL